MSYCILHRYEGDVCSILKLDVVKLTWVHVCNFISYYTMFCTFCCQSTLFIVSKEEEDSSTRKLLYLDESRRMVKNSNIDLPFMSADYLTVPAHIFM